MKGYNYVSKNFLLPTSDIILGMSVSRQLRFLERSQWWSFSRLEEYQNKKLRSLVMHAYRNVPYYHNLFKSLMLDPENIRTKDDLTKLPILTKEDIRKDPESFLSINIKKKNFIKDSTSGSSGKVFEFYVDKNLMSIFRAMGVRGWEFAGYSFGDRITTIAGSSLLPNKMSILKKIMFKTSRNLPLSSYNMNKDKIGNYVKQIINFKSDFIRGYPSSIAIIADYILKNNIQGVKPSAIITTSETLNNADKKLISEGFDCDIYDQCGCNDGGEDLCECKEHSGYHIGAERAIHEFVYESNESNNGYAHIILTDLCNYTMPFIRYDAGDMGIPTEDICQCGRGLPLVKSIIGRSIDRIVLPDGTYMPGLVISEIFDSDASIIGSIREYQIIQENIDKFNVNIVKNENYDNETSKKICKYFEGCMGIPLDIKFNFVSNVPRTDANKRRIVISKIRGGNV